MGSLDAGARSGWKPAKGASWRAARLAVALAGTLGLGGCSGSEDGADAASASTDPVVTASLTLGLRCVREGQTTAASWSTAGATWCSFEASSVPTTFRVTTAPIGAGVVQETLELKCWSGRTQPTSCPMAAGDCRTSADRLTTTCSHAGCALTTGVFYNTDALPTSMEASSGCTKTYPDPCATSVTCSACTARSGCGWCASSNACRSGSAVGPSPGVCWDWRYGSCFNGRCGGTGDTCASQSCCSYVAPTMCCAPPFCGGNCVGSPCCL